MHESLKNRKKTKHKYKDYKKIDGHVYELMTHIGEKKRRAQKKAKFFRSNDYMHYDGIPAKGVRVIKTAKGYAVYVR